MCADAGVDVGVRGRWRARAKALQQRATSNATTCSTTTLAAGTAQTSERSYCEASACLVFRSTLGMPRSSVLMGFMAARTTTGCPLVMPPSVPPALLVSRTKPSAGVSRRAGSKRMGSCTALPGRDAHAKPSPISTPLIACTPITAQAMRASSLSRQSMHEPTPGGQPKTCASTTPPTVSLSILAWRMISRWRAETSASGQ